MAKKTIILVWALSFFQIAAASTSHFPNIIKKSISNDISNQFASSSKTSQIEWGCPVNDRIQANSRAEALDKVEGECRAQIRRAATSKPDVLDVIQTSVIWPDVQITETESRHYFIVGTLFYETLVLNKLKTGE